MSDVGYMPSKIKETRYRIEFRFKNLPYAFITPELDEVTFARLTGEFEADRIEYKPLVMLPKESRDL
jgi:hypothetical protein